MSPRLEGRGISVRFGGLLALDRVDLEVADGAILGLIGPNGAGKTTCFGVLSGLVRPQSGQVLMDGHDVTGASPQRRARAGLARTFQRLEVFSGLTVREHLVVAYRSRGRNVATRIALDCLGAGRRPFSGEDEAIETILDRLGLTKLAAAPAGALPLGTGRLVELGRALATRPRVLLLDEPSSGLDADETAALTELLRSLQAELDLSLVLVEHNVDMVLGLAHRVTVLDFGQVIADGTPAEVRASEAVQTAYLGAAP